MVWCSESDILDVINTNEIIIEEFKPRFMGGFFFGQVTVSGEKYMADTHGCPLKNLPKIHTRVTPTVPFPTNKTKQLMAIVARLDDQ